MRVKGWAETAYDAYRQYFAEFGQIVPQFADLPEDQLCAWRRAANTLVDACREWDASGRRVVDDGTVVERDGTPVVGDGTVEVS